MKPWERSRPDCSTARRLLCRRRSPIQQSTAAATQAAAPGGPRLELAKIIGDMRGAGMHNLSVTVTDQGEACLLVEEGRIAIFSPDGIYQQVHRGESSPGQRPTSTSWPRAGVSWRAIIASIILGCSPPGGKARRAGRFQNPAMATQDAEGRTYVADRGNGRIQVFSADNHAVPQRIIKIPGGAGPLALDVRGPQMAVLTDRGTLLVFDLSGDVDRPIASLDVGPGAHSVAIGPKAMIHVAFNGGPDRYDLRKYQIEAGKLVEVAVVARSFMAQWPNFFPAATPLATDAQGQVWFATDLAGKLLSLDPRSDTVRERGTVPWRALAVQFGPDGTCHAVGYAGPRRQDPHQHVSGTARWIEAARHDCVPGKRCRKTRPCRSGRLLPDSDGGVYVRVVEEGYRKGWPALAIKKVYPDGRMEPFLDFGELYAVRRTFGPWDCVYSLQFDAAAQHHSGGPAAASRLPGCPRRQDPLGGGPAAARRRRRDPVSGPTASGSRQPRADLGRRRRDRQDLLSFAPGQVAAGVRRPGHLGRLAGRGFSHPSGIASVRIDAVDYLYVGDAGNQRIVKYRIR